MATRWQCEVCSYIHEGATPPDECPICGVGPDQFSPYPPEEAGAPEPPPPASRWRCTVCDFVHESDAPPEKCPVCGVGADLFVPETAEPEPQPVRHAAPVVAGTSAERLVIVGGGVAGVTAAEHARLCSSDLAVTLVHKEAGLPYNRLNLTRFLAGEVEEGKLDLHGQSWYDSRSIELLRGEVAQLDTDEARLELRDGRTIAYDRLVLANGAHPFLPPIAGASRQGVVALRTREDARRVLERTRPGLDCVCVGGGLLGLEVAGGLARRNVRVSVLEGFDWLLPRQLAEPAGKLLQRHLEQLGITIRCPARIAELVGDESVRAVRLEDGEELSADVVIIATGVRPNSFLARQSGIEVATGIVVDDRMQTSAPGVFAAGDVAEHRGRVYGLWPAAIEQGRVAGSNAAGGRESFSGMPPATQLKVLDVAIFSIGEITPRDGASRIVEQQSADTYLRLVCRDGTLVGANLFGDMSLAGAVRDAIESRTQIADLSDKSPQLGKLV